MPDSKMVPFSADYGTCGLYRAIILEDKGESMYSVYIEKLHKTAPPFTYDSTGVATGVDTSNAIIPESETSSEDSTDSPTEDSTSTEAVVTESITSASESLLLSDFPIASCSAWGAKFKLKPMDVVFVIVEHGEIVRPVIIGQLGCVLPEGDLMSKLFAPMSTCVTPPSETVVSSGDGYLQTDKYTLSDDELIVLASLVTGECGGSDMVACRQEASQIANLYEKRKRNGDTRSIVDYVKNGGWYASSSFGRGYTETALAAVKEVFTDGKRYLPRYVTEHDMFASEGKDIINMLSRDSYKRHETPVKNRYGGEYIFYCFFGSNGDGDIAGYYKSDYDAFKDDESSMTQPTTPTTSTTEVPEASGSWVDPTNYTVITGKYGTNRGDHIHAGVDIRGYQGTPVYASQSGVVSAVKGLGGVRGRYVVLNHGNGLISVYQHLASYSVSVGQSVSAGQQIGTNGGSGKAENSYSPHLHFEIREGNVNAANPSSGTHVNPAKYLTRLNSYSFA